MTSKLAWNGDHGQSTYLDWLKIGTGVSYETVTVKSALAVNLATGADAIGTNTLASTSVDLRVVSRGLLSYAVGNATSLAAAGSTSGDTPYASTYAMADVYGGDYVMQTSHEQSGESASGVMQSSSLSFLAIDLGWLDVLLGATSTTSVVTEPQVDIKGNVAKFDIHAEAQGDNSYADVSADAIAVDGHFSSVTSSTTAAVDSTASYCLATGTKRADLVLLGNENSIVNSGDGNDIIWSKGGDDWIFGGNGSDSVYSGEGNNTVLAGEGKDFVTAGKGDDWLLGQGGDDDLKSGDGGDLVLGGKGKDEIDAGAGDDLICGGEGDDVLNAGSGNDLLRLGGTAADGNDIFSGGKGADLYWIAGSFGKDQVRDFNLSQGDRLYCGFGDWDSEDGLRQLNGDTVTLHRGSDKNDLVITFQLGDKSSTLVLDQFFLLNPGYGAGPKRGIFSDEDALRLLQDLFGDDAGVYSGASLELFAVGDFLTDLG